MNALNIFKRYSFFASTLVVLFTACSSDDDEDNGTPSTPETVSIQEATTGEYEMKAFDADLEVDVTTPFGGLLLYVTVEGKNFIGKVSFTDQKVVFDNTLDAVLTLDVGGTTNPDTLELELKAQMTYEILGDNELRFYVDENDPNDEPLRLVSGLELDDITLSVVERTTQRFRLQGDVDADVDLGGALPGVSGSHPTTGIIKITLER